MSKELVSIIIPTYNRENLIKETLDSILKQSYPEWECIVVDDGSQDGTIEVLEAYHKKNTRIKYFSRPKEKLKGANSCRNFGFSKSKGDYIIWFDSDDLMTTDHIMEKIKSIENTKSDFVVAKTQNFRGDKFLKPYEYEKKSYGIRASDFILLKIHWYTYDVMLKRKIAERISWNEEMKSWQDYNYFCKMLLVTENGYYLDTVLTQRRLHLNSIQKSLTKSKRRFNGEMLENKLLTFNDIKEKVDFYTRKEMVYGLMNLSYELMLMRVFQKEILQVVNIVRKNIGIKAYLLFITGLKMVFLFGKGYFLIKRAKKTLKIAQEA